MVLISAESGTPTVLRAKASGCVTLPWAYFMNDTIVLNVACLYIRPRIFININNIREW